MENVSRVSQFTFKPEKKFEDLKIQKNVKQRKHYIKNEELFKILHYFYLTN